MEEEKKEQSEGPTLEEAKARMSEIKGKLLTLKWDYEHDQINPAKKLEYEALKKEYEMLEKQVEGSQE